MNLAHRLKEQNNGYAWLDCESRGLKHRPVRDPNISIRVSDVVYEACTRCPVVVRKQVRECLECGAETTDSKRGLCVHCYLDHIL